MPFGLNEPGFLPAATRPCTAHAVDWVFEEAPPVSDQPPVPCWDERSHLTAGLDLTLAAGRGGERLHHRSGAVGLAVRAGDRAPAAVLVLDPCAATCADLPSFELVDLGRPQGEDRVGGQVDLLLVGAVAVLAVAELADEVAAAEVARLDAGADEGDDRPLEVAGRGDRGDVAAQVGDRRVAGPADVERVDPRAASIPSIAQPVIPTLESAPGSVP